MFRRLFMKLSIWSVCFFSISLLCDSQFVSAQVINQDTAIVAHTDVHPQFRGGIRGWTSFVSQNLNVRKLMHDLDSATFVDYGFKQSALIEFTVCEDGKICDAVVLNKEKVSPEFAEEALRVMNKSPRWTPGIKDGKVVRTRFRQSIVAVLVE